MFRKLAFGTAGIALASLSVFFFGITLYIARTEVWPALRKGSMSVETSSMILNVLWEGNEIYVLLVAYLLLAIGGAFVAARFLKTALQRR